MYLAENIPARLKFYISVFMFFFISSCGGGGGGSSSDASPSSIEVSERPSNQIFSAYFRDQDGASGELAGTIVIEATAINKTDTSRVESVWVYWANEQGNPVGEAWLKTSSDSPYEVEVPSGTPIPGNIEAMLLYPANGIGQAAQASIVLFHDFIGNAMLAGPGGNESEAWYYGVDRPKIPVHRSGNQLENSQDSVCSFDNGLVSVTDMNNTRDEAWESNSSNGLPNIANDNAFPAYTFLCAAEPVNTHRAVTDELGVWTYSTLNDAMFYGTIVYDTFLKYLGEPALEEKIRLRVHYAEENARRAYWDGAYANFSDGYPHYYSMASLDAIGHEVGHGVLSRISGLKAFDQALGTDARTIHEAFADISGYMSKYEFTGNTDNWIHGEEAGGLTRKLNQIKTEPRAIDSFLDYDDAGKNFYLRIGMITYPFYLLSKQWGVEPAYGVFVDSARTCWTATISLTLAAECIKQSAALAGLAEADVIEAFKTVKIKLFTEGVLSHFEYDAKKLTLALSDDNRSSSQISDWLWDFGDGQTSSEVNPTHIYAGAGKYQVSLMVTDQAGGQDSFQRLISLTDQYCSISPLSVDNQITELSIGGVEINYDPGSWDYTQTPIQLNEPSATIIDIKGASLATARSTTWKIWIDINNDGIYGDTSEELMAEVAVPAGQPYALSTSLDFSALPNDGEAKYLRIIGDYVVISPCSAGIGEALDLRVNW